MESHTILIKNVIIIDSEIKKGSILIENDEISEINDNINSANANEVIKGEGKILIPGLINTHTHLPMTLMRGLADDMPLNTWLNEYIWPAEANLNGQHCYAGALLACVEMIKSGTTTFNDMYFFVDDIARAVGESGLRGVLSYGMIDLGDEGKRKKEYKESIRVIKKCHDTYDGRVKIALGPHAPYTCSMELLNWVRRKADKLGVRIHIHVSETEQEVAQIIDSYGARPFEYLDEIDFLGNDVLAAHGVWLSDSEMDIIKDNQVNLSHNPTSNMKLASGVSPVTKMIDKGINVSLGTDGAASNNNLDLLEEMKITALLQKIHNLDSTLLTAKQAFEMATIKGAEALGIENEIGSIEVGKKADLTLINFNKTHLTPYRNPLSHLVYSAQGGDVDTVICNGRILMQERELLVLDEKEVIQQAVEASQDLLS